MIVRVTDAGGLTHDVTVLVDIIDRNEAPVGTNDSFATTEESAISGDVLANDGDVDGDAIESPYLVGPRPCPKFQLESRRDIYLHAQQRFLRNRFVHVCP